MKFVEITAVNEINVGDVAAPTLAANQVMVDIKYSGICGSDMHFFLGHHPSLKPPTGFIQGHEAVGVVSAVGEQAQGFAVGDRVAINPLVGCGECFNCLDNLPNICRVSRKVMGFRLNGTMCEQMAVEPAQLIKLHPQADLRVAAMIEPFAVGHHAVSLVKWRDLTALPVIVTGGGTIGVVTALVLKYLYSADPLIVEKDPQRIAQLEGMGFRVYGSVAEVDVLQLRQRPVVFECTGYYPVLEALIAAQRKPEQIVIIGQYQPGSTVGLHEIMSSEITITSSHMYNSDDLQASADAVRQPEIEQALRGIVYQQVFSLEEAASAFAKATSGQLDGKLKVLIGQP
ncbi:alcohol dehydrogenase catalytic domain-containing protein (plasmid) [Erwinia sp. INIA-01]|uniref:zinc-dependent alcohol dehydrogenase n=1 Tax=Erwinia sp. INIA01 TaxID=2991500 RepID=UPI002224F242|nr:alcohol dehydrogenase catalytic domain-containing protein [Erwinia sp. INIA01]MCW1873032.1 alcohol dehydrogenase catalytic domain-containing protein [Erwinia sp. INIA01]